MLLPRQRRSAATDTSTSSSGVTSVVISTATARPLVATIANTDEAAGEKTTKRISRQVLHRRLRRLGRKLDDVMTMFKDVADAARIEGKGGRSGQKRGARAGQNARRRLRGKGGRFVAAPREEEVKDSHPDPSTILTTKPRDQEERQVAVVVERRKKTKKQRRRERGSWPTGSKETEAREAQVGAEAREAQVGVAERERQQERQEETDRLNRLERKLIQTQTELRTAQTDKEQTDKQLQAALNTNAQLQSQMTELLDQITEVTEVTRAQTETDQFCTAELKQKLATEQDRVATAQIQIELSTEMNEQLQIQITDLTTMIQQLRDRPTEHDRKQTDTLPVTAIPKTAAPQMAAAVKRTRVMPRARQVTPKKAPAPKKVWKGAPIEKRVVKGLNL